MVDSLLRKLREEIKDLQSLLILVKAKIDSLDKQLSLYEGEQLKDVIQKKEEIKTEANGKIPVREKSPHLEEPVKPSIPVGTLTKKGNFEARIGQYWLNKIGIVSLVIGISLFIAYTFKYLGPVTKIGIGYLISVFILLCGIMLEKKPGYSIYGKSLIGGGWALVYFTTYAMHYIKATQILKNPVIDLILLGIVVAVIIFHSIKYRAQIVTGLAFFLGFWTCGISDIRLFSFLYCSLLALGIFIIVYKLQWHRFALYGLVATYLTHFIWFAPKIHRAQEILGYAPAKFVLAILFLTLYWIIYAILAFVLSSEDKKRRSWCIGISLANAFFYSQLGIFLFHTVYPEQKYIFLLLLGIGYIILSGIFRLTQFSHLSIPNTLIGISFMTLSIPLKLTGTWITLSWLLESLILIIIGFKFKELKYRIFGNIVAIMSGIKVLFIDVFSGSTFGLFGWSLNSRIIIFIIAAIVYYAITYCYRLVRYQSELNQRERYLHVIYAVSATFLLSFITFFEIEKDWLALAWLTEGLLLSGAGFYLKDKLFRIMALVIFAATIYAILCFNLAGWEMIYKIITFIFLGAVLLTVSYIYSKYSAEIDKD